MITLAGINLDTKNDMIKILLMFFIYLISVVLMILLPKCLRLQGMTPASIIVNCVPNFIGPIMIAQWAFQNRPAFGIGPSEINLMIVTIYLSCILSILFIFIYPRLVSMEQKKENRMPKVCTLFV